MDIKDIRAQTGLNRADFSRRYNIPYRTVEDWEAGKKHPPNWVATLLNRIITIDFKGDK